MAARGEVGTGPYGSTSAYVYKCISCTYTHTHVDACIYMETYTNTCIHTHVYIYLHTHLPTYLPTYTYMYICIYIYVYVYIYMYTLCALPCAWSRACAYTHRATLNSGLPLHISPLPTCCPSRG